jgi:hypothetical protein
VTCTVPPRPAMESDLDPEAEKAVQVITDEILARWK